MFLSTKLEQNGAAIKKVSIDLSFIISERMTKGSVELLFVILHIQLFYEIPSKLETSDIHTLLILFMEITIIFFEKSLLLVSLYIFSLVYAFHHVAGTQ